MHINIKSCHTWSWSHPSISNLWSQDIKRVVHMAYGDQRSIVHDTALAACLVSLLCTRGRYTDSIDIQMNESIASSHLISPHLIFCTNEETLTLPHTNLCVVSKTWKTLLPFLFRQTNYLQQWASIGFVLMPLISLQMKTCKRIHIQIYVCTCF